MKGRSKHMKRLTLILALALATTTLAAGCAGLQSGSLGTAPTGGTSPTPTPTESPPATSPADTSTPSATPIPSRPFSFEVWFSAGERLFITRRTEPFEPGVARLALTALLAGPNQAERAAGISSAVPEGTRLLGLNLKDGVLTVDLSGEFKRAGGTAGETMRLAQVIYTATQFDTVEAVRLAIGGKVLTSFGGHGIDVSDPLTRDRRGDLLPAILVESPSIGAIVSSPVTISGTADVFEATVSIRILDAAGREVARTFTTATCGTGCRGEYSAAVRYQVNREQMGAIQVYESSAQDGSAINVQHIPVTLTP
jgi:hypothetical protein